LQTQVQKFVRTVSNSLSIDNTTMTRNTAVFLLVACLLLMGNTAAIPSPRRKLTLRHPRGTTSTITEENKLLKLRGGDLGSIDGKSLAKVFSVLASSDAIAGALIPRTSMKYFGIYIAPGSLSNKYIHGIGASAATIAVASYLAVNGSPLEQALGYGFAARLVSMTLMILTDNELKVGMNFPIFGTMWMVLATTVYALFTNSWEPLTLTKIVSLVLGMHGLFLYMKPEVFLRKTAISIGPGKFKKGKRSPSKVE